MSGVKNSVSFKIFASDLTLIVNKIKNSSFPVYKLKTVHEKYLTGEVRWHDLNYLKKLLEINNATLEITSKKGTIFTIINYKKRIGLLIGAVLASAIIFYLSNTVLKINVYGNNFLSDSHVTSVLSNYGISIGKFIPSLDLRKAETEIITAFDQFRWIGIRSNGSTIEVEVSELNPKPDMVPINSPCNIISTKNAQIVGIQNVYRGMLVPMLYDGVKEGEILISGTVKGKLEHDYFVHSIGDIIGRYDENITFYQPITDQEQIYTSKIIKKDIYFWGIKIPISLQKDPQSEFELEEDTDFIEFFGITFPVGITEKTYKPYYYAEKICSTEEAKQILERKMINHETNFYENSETKIIDRKISYLETENEIILNINYTLEGNIGKEQEIFAKK